MAVGISEESARNQHRINLEIDTEISIARLGRERLRVTATAEIRRKEEKRNV
ncbi:hypothetical protein [Actinopolymorpha rutila]|uniref:Uncharacterized protein n=1 Tax=Actinopolymorpha rutila TaxID=446787 RepID=A0A852ZS16_9ACTN|nr:hypothetical protein [Actinopolymorpha rutila]NYH91406.1 hypothetical protein [Actinopolymorpha rutila]